MMALIKVTNTIGVIRLCLFGVEVGWWGTGVGSVVYVSCKFGVV